MASYRIITNIDPITKAITYGDGPAVGKSLIEIATAVGPYCVQVDHQAIDIVTVAGPNEGEFIDQRTPKSWDETCQQVADQVIASLGAP